MTMVLNSLGVLSTCVITMCVLGTVRATGVCREDIFSMFTNLTIDAESVNFTISNVVYCKRLCGDVGDNLLFSFHVESESCRCFTWPVTLLSAVNAVPIYISSEYVAGCIKL